MEGNASARKHLVQVKEGGRYHVIIQDVGRQGDGITRVGGMVIFVRESKPGEEIDIVVTKLGKNCAFAEKVLPDAPADGS